MEKDSQIAFKAELRELFEKYGLKDGSFAATDKEGRFHALMTLHEAPNIAGLFQSVLNIGRLWQHARVVVKDILDDFQGGMK